MAKTHYEILGLTGIGTSEEVRKAYRKMVLEHHPDRSTKPESKKIFLLATEAYQVLNDPERKEHYDAMLALKYRQSERPQPKPTPKAQPRTAVSTERAQQVARLSLLFSRGQHKEAESLATQITQTDPKHPLPYAILGDLARMRGELARASKMYAYAVQMDPRNATYQRKYEEVVGPRFQPQLAAGAKFHPVLVAAAMTLFGCLYIILSKEKPFLPMVGLISSWTLGLLVMLFLAGVSLGASLSVAGWIDRFNAVSRSSIGKVTPSLALATIAIVNFWAAALTYVGLGFSQKAFNYSNSRLLTGVGVIVLLFTASAMISTGSVDGTETLLWGGNAAYLGALCGWLVADSLKA